MRILVTGAAGFIGSHLTDRFIADGHEVIGLDNYSTGRAENVNAAADVYRQDIRQIAQVIHSAGKPDLIVHCAASYADPDKWHRDTETNVLGTINTVIEARTAGCPLVYMQTALPPVSSYAISKTAGMQYIQQSGVPHLIFRLANIYGPRNLSGPVPTFWKRITAGEPVTVVDTTRDMVYVDDLVDCVMLALAGMNAGVFDVCSGHETTIQDLYSWVLGHTGKRHVDNPCKTIAPPPDEAMTEVSIKNRVPNWRAAVDLERGIRETCQWYEDNPPTQTFTHLRLAEPARV